MDIGDIEQMTAELSKSIRRKSGGVEIGAKATLTAEALSSSLKGTVTRIGLEIGRQSLVDSSPAANTDASVVEVTITLDEAIFKGGKALHQSAGHRPSSRDRLPGQHKMTRFLAHLLGRMPIGWLQLSHNKTRLAAAIAGVAFANILIFMQLGFHGRSGWQHQDCPMRQSMPIS